MDNSNLIQFATLILSVITGFSGVVPLVNKIKELCNLSGRYAQLVLVFVIVLFSTATLILQGVLSVDNVSFNNLAYVFVTIFTASQAEYQRQKYLE